MAAMNEQEFAQALSEALEQDYDENDGWMSSRQILRAVPGLNKKRLRDMLHVLHDKDMLKVSRRPRRTIVGDLREVPVYQIADVNDG